MVEVPVIKAFTHEGRALVAGDTIAVSPLDAVLLCRRGLVSLTRGYRTAAITPEPAPVVEPVAPVRRRRSRRRDLTAAETA